MKPLSFIQSPNKGQKNKTDINILESKLRTLYQQLINLVKIKPKSKNEQKTILEKLKMYQSSSQMLEVSIQMVLYLIRKQREIIMQNSGQFSNSGLATEGSLFTPMGTIYTSEQYRNLENSIQKLQLRNRQLIKKQQMTKLYCDDLQQKLKEGEKANLQLQGSVKHIIITLKKENHQFQQENNKLKKELYQIKLQSHVKTDSFYRRDMENPQIANVTNLNRIVGQIVKDKQDSKNIRTNGVRSIKALNKLDYIIRLDQNSNNSKQGNSSNRNLRSKVQQKQSSLINSLSRRNSVSGVKISRVIID